MFCDTEWVRQTRMIILGVALVPNCRYCQWRVEKDATTTKSRQEQPARQQQIIATTASTELMIVFHSCDFMLIYFCIACDSSVTNICTFL